VNNRKVLVVAGVAHDAPIPLGVRIGQSIFTSALMGMDPVTSVIPDDPAEQARLVFNNLRAVLAAGGADLGDVAKVTVFAADDSVRPLLNKEWLACFPDPDDRPARHVIVGALPRNVVIQLEVTAVITD
jgi:2-iminobutanoate/2-iminopropanoate deaminase